MKTRIARVARRKYRWEKGWTLDFETMTMYNMFVVHKIEIDPAKSEATYTIAGCNPASFREAEVKAIIKAFNDYIAEKILLGN